MKVFSFACDATETLRGRAFFEVEAESEDEARALLVADAAEYFTEFSETDGSTEWEAAKPEDWDSI